MSTTTRQAIEDFLSQRRIAVVGASRRPRQFGRSVMEALRSRGYEVFPVNPNANDLGGIPCHASIGDVAQDVTAALVLVPPSERSRIALECARAGIKRLWIHGHARKEALDPAILHACQETGTELIYGHCPFMFMPGAGFPHNLHGWIAQRLGDRPH